jgi:RAB protein geranylgeranyltransferase component A
VSKKGFYVCIISGMVETKDPVAELKCAFDLIGSVLEKFVTVKKILSLIWNMHDLKILC